MINRIARLLGRCLLIGMAAIFVHEVGHYLTAWVLGLRPWMDFKTSVYKFGGLELKIRTPVTRYDTVKGWKTRLVATMGFGACLLFACALALACSLNFMSAWWLFAFLCAVSIHFITYPFRMRDDVSNDFNLMDADDNPRN